MDDKNKQISKSSHMLNQYGAEIGSDGIPVYPNLPSSS